MNRTDRLLAIVLELQGKGQRRAEDLATTFETSKRTIYRDVQALCEAGVPVTAVPGQGYSLVEGYFLPPLSFSTDEASMLLLGSGFVAENFDEEYRAAAQSAARKIESVLPEKLRQEVQERHSSIRLVAQAGGASANLKLLRRAVVERRTVAFSYYARHNGSEPPRSREADPYGLVFYDKAWYMAAYCHLRHEIRRFRLDRINQPVLTAKIFRRPADFKLEQGQSQSDRLITLRVLFDRAVARWVKETRYFYVVAEEETEAGLLVTLQVRQEDDAINWLLGWGRQARVLEPASLQARLREEAAAILHQYENS